MYGENDVDCEQCVYAASGGQTVVCCYYGPEECDPYGQCQSFDPLTDEIKTERWFENVQDAIWANFQGRYFDLDSMNETFLAKVSRLEKNYCPESAADVILRWILAGQRSQNAQRSLAGIPPGSSSARTGHCARSRQEMKGE